jgi:hypothetical protein
VLQTLLLLLLLLLLEAEQGRVQQRWVAGAVLLRGE